MDKIPKGRMQYSDIVLRISAGPGIGSFPAFYTTWRVNKIKRTPILSFFYEHSLQCFK